MSTRVTPRYPTLKQVSKQLWIVKEVPVVCETRGMRIIVPVGEETDGASVPRAFWPIMPPMSNYTNAAVVHDFLYKYKGEIIDHTVKIAIKLDRARADKIFLDAMETLGVSWWKRKTMYRAVRAFGPRW